MNKTLTISILLTLLLLNGCSVGVQPWERDLLAQKNATGYTSTRQLSG